MTVRIAWFSPLPPLRSGVARYNADLLARLDGQQAIDRFVDGLGRTPPGARTFDAHHFVWKHRRNPYDLITYQLGNASCHDFMWAYLVRYPGLVVVHDPRLHHAVADKRDRQRGDHDHRGQRGAGRRGKTKIPLTEDVGPVLEEELE